MLCISPFHSIPFHATCHSITHLPCDSSLAQPMRNSIVEMNGACTAPVFTQHILSLGIES